MKSISLICLALLFTLFSCEGPEGPPGVDGVDAVNIEGFTFEYENIDFTAGNGYEVLLTFPGDFQMLDSDVALVYLLWDVVDNVPVWRALPNTSFTDWGKIQYNFDFTVNDVKLFLDADFDPLDIPAESEDIYLNDWIARVVVVPAQFTSGRTAAVDYSDYYAVVKHFNIEDKPLPLNAEKYAKRP